MMKNDTCKKALVLGIIVLFIGMSNMSIAGNLSMEKQALHEFIPFAQSTDGNSGISLITIKVNGEMGLNDWYVSNVNFNFTYESDDIEEIYFQIDGGPEQTYTEPFNLTEDGEEILLEWRAVDHEGNYSDVDGPFTCSIDQTEPDIDLTYEYSGSQPPYKYTYIANATDAKSGMERVEFYLNGVLRETVYGTGPEYTYTLTYTPIPSALWKAIAYDMAGNSDYDIIMDPVYLKVLKSSLFKSGINKDSRVKNSSYDIFASKIVEKENNKATKKSFDCSNDDAFDPAYIMVVSDIITGVNGGVFSDVYLYDRKSGEIGWLFNDVNVSIFYELDRIDEVYYKINDGDWISYTEPLVISEDGINVFSWYVVDSEGYTSTPDSIIIKIDNNPPEIRLKKERLAIDRVKVIADVYDKGSGIDWVKFRNRGKRFTDYDFPYEWNLTGIFNGFVYATVYDKVGRSNSTKIWTWGRQSYNQQFSSLLFISFLERFPLLARLLSLL